MTVEGTGNNGGGGGEEFISKERVRYSLRMFEEEERGIFTHSERAPLRVGVDSSLRWRHQLCTILHKWWTGHTPVSLLSSLRLRIKVARIGANAGIITLH